MVVLMKPSTAVITDATSMKQQCVYSHGSRDSAIVLSGLQKLLFARTW